MGGRSFDGLNMWSEVTGSNLGQDNSYPHFSWLFSVIGVNSLDIITSGQERFLPNRSQFTIHPTVHFRTVSA
jgi:hypothetical protein